MSFTKNAPDEEAVRLLRYYEGLALHYDVRGYCAVSYTHLTLPTIRLV